MRRQKAKLCYVTNDNILTSNGIQQRTRNPGMFARRCGLSEGQNSATSRTVASCQSNGSQRSTPNPGSFVRPCVLPGCMREVEKEDESNVVPLPANGTDRNSRHTFGFSRRAD